MAKSYIHVVNAKGKVYRYFRPPGGSNVAGRIRLPDDEAAAEAMVKKILEDPAIAPTKPKTKRDVFVIKLRLEGLIKGAKARARKRGIPFDIDVEYLAGLFAKQKGRCAVTEYGMNANRGRDPYAVSIDQIEAGKGYTRGNVRLVCHAANMAMSDWGEGVVRKLFAWR